MTDAKGRSPRDPNPWFRGSKRYGDLGRHAPPGDELENTRDHERIWEELDAVKSKYVTDARGIVWTVPPLENAWVNAGAPFEDFAYRWEGHKDSLIFRGHLTGGVSGTDCCHLYPEDWPTKDLSSITDVITPGIPAAAQIRVRASDGGVRITSVGTGTVGPPGPPGAGLTYTHTQGAVSSTWIIAHGLGVFPSVSVVDTGDSVILPDVHYDSATQLTLTFGAPTSGKAFLN